MTTRVLACALLAVAAVGLAGCADDEDENAATTAAATSTSKSFGVELPRTGDYGLHDGLASFVPEDSKTRVIVDFPVSAGDLPDDGLPTQVVHGSCASPGEIAYELDPSSGITQTVLDVQSAELEQGFDSGSLAVTIERSPSDHDVVACGDIVTEGSPG